MADPLSLFASDGAIFSPDRVYRYRLARRWLALSIPAGADPSNRGKVVAWIMLNPSTADETRNDPTIRRCIAFSRAWGFGGLEILNLFAVRGTDPAVLSEHGDPVGPDNDAAIVAGTTGAGLVVAAWGASVPKCYANRPRAVARLLAERGAPVWCLGRTRAGAPRHPLYVAGSTGLERFDGRGAL